jgi:Coenzyme PQQ synthesis protein D (PqqD)
MKERYTVCRDVLFTQLDDGSGVLLNLGSGLYYTLNRAGVIVWKAVGEGEWDVGALARRLCAVFEVDRVEAEREAARLLDELRKDGLVRVERV